MGYYDYHHRPDGLFDGCDLGACFHDFARIQAAGFDLALRIELAFSAGGLAPPYLRINSFPLFKSLSY